MESEQTVHEIVNGVVSRAENPENISDEIAKPSLIDRVALKLAINQDKFLRLHFAEWEKNLKSESSRPKYIIHTVEADQAHDALADCIAKDIESQAAISRYNLAKRKMITAIDEFEEQLNPEIEWEAEIIQYPESGKIEVLLLKSEKVVIDEAIKILFAAIKTLIESEEAELEKVADGNFPKAFEAPFDLIKGMKVKELVNDIAQYLLENGQEGRDLARQVCIDLEMAKQIAQDEAKPAPLVFLAKIAVKELE